MTQDNHDGVVTHLEPGILECEVKWALRNITTNKASEGDGIPAELFQILKDDTVKVLLLIHQQIWETQQWPEAIPFTYTLFSISLSVQFSRLVVPDSL